jgi:hypothetical protein
MGRLLYRILFVIARQLVLPAPEREIGFAQRTGFAQETGFVRQDRRAHAPPRDGSSHTWTDRCRNVPPQHAQARDAGTTL